MQVLAFLLMLAAFGFMAWATVSLVLAIIRKVKAKKAKDKEKGENVNDCD